MNKADKDSKKKSPEELEKERLEAPAYYQRPTLAQIKTFGTVTLHEFEGISKCEGVPIVEGFPSEGLTSILVANYLVEELNLPLVGVVTSKEFPPMAMIAEYKPTFGCRLYGNEKLVVAMCEYKLTPEVSNDVATMLFDLAKRIKSPVIVSTEGIPTDLDIDRSKVTSQMELMHLVQQMAMEEAKKPIDQVKIKYVTTVQGYGESLKQRGAHPVKAAGIGGLTGGVISGSLLAPHVNVLVLFACVNSAVPDGRGAQAIVVAMNDLLSLGVDLDPLAEQVKEMEKKVHTVLTGLASPRSRAAGQPSMMYT